VRHDPQQFALPIGDLRPPPSEEIRIELVLDRLDGDALLLVVRVLADEDVVDLPADELDEVSQTTRLSPKASVSEALALNSLWRAESNAMPARAGCAVYER